MADDLDQLIRAAMKTLDAEVPSGYFETLPNQTIARLEGSMQHGSSGTTDTRDDAGAPPVALDGEDAPVANEEVRDDSGLHDIRNLAQSTKQRLSSRRITAPPVADDVLASSSGSFKAIALPQPASMVSLPVADDASDKAAKRAAKEEAKLRKSEQKLGAVPLEAPAHGVAAPGAFALPPAPKKSKAPLIALVGTGLAAAAGAVIFLQVNKGQDAEHAAAPASATEQTAAQDRARAAAAPAPSGPIVEPIAPPPAPTEPNAAVAIETAPAAAGIAANERAEERAEEQAEEQADDKRSPKKSAKGKGAQKSKAERTPPTKHKIEEKNAPEKVETKKPDAKKATDAKPAGGDDGEPSFDALLKEAGVSEKKEAKPVLEKKSLTGDDFKKGMASVAAKAKGCYTGTQGTATVKLTIAPSGKVSKVAVGGEFAGKPEAACIESALRGATFPPWDGGPQSFSYAVLLSD